MKKHTRALRAPVSPAHASLFSLPPLAQSIRAVLIPVGVSLGIVSQGVFALPVQDGIDGASSRTSDDGKTMDVYQTARHGRARYTSFNTKVDEQLNIHQKSVGDSFTAWVSDPNRVNYLGGLHAIGAVTVISNGIYFGKNSVVNVGSFLALSHYNPSLDNKEWDGGERRRGNVINEGDITASAGDVVFIGDWVKNTGKITAEGGVNLYGKRIINEGTVTASTGGVYFSGDQITNAEDGLIIAKAGEVEMVGGGTQTTLEFEGDGLLRFAVDSRVLDGSKGAEKSAVTNRGTIKGKTVLLDAKAARAVFTYAVNNEGIIRATHADSSGGTIRLLGGTTGNVASSGTLDASSTKSGKSGGKIEIGGAKVDISGNVLATGDAAGGTIRAEAVERLTVGDRTEGTSTSISVRSENAKGGEAALLGKEVVLLGKTHIDASGKTGGGIVRIGGGYQGGEKAYRNSLDTYLGENVTADVSARLNGDGGKAVVWSDNMTYYHGLIKADAGKEGGDGGFIEVSGKKSFDIRGGRFSATAPFGKLGTVLLDPDNIYLRAGSAQANESGPRALTSGDPIEITFQSDLAPLPDPKAYIYADQLTNLLNRNTATYILQAADTISIGDNGTNVAVSSNSGSLLMRAQTVTAGSNFTFNATGGSNVSFGIDATTINLKDKDISITGGTRLGQISIGGTSGTNIGWGDSTNTAFNRGKTTASITMGKFNANGGTGLTINATGALKIGTDGGSNNGFQYDGSGNVTVQGGTGSAAYLGVVRLDNVDGNIAFEIDGDIEMDALLAGSGSTGLKIEGTSFTITGNNTFVADLRYRGSGDVNIEATTGDVTIVGDVLLENSSGLGAISITADGNGSPSTTDDGTIKMDTFTANSGSSRSELTTTTDSSGNVTEKNTTISALGIKAGTIMVGTTMQPGDLTYRGDGTVKIEATAGNASLGNVNLTDTSLGAIHLRATGALTMGEFNANSGEDTQNYTSITRDRTGDTINNEGVTDGAFEMRAGAITVNGLTYGGKDSVKIEATFGNASLGNVILTNATDLKGIRLTAAKDLTIGRLGGSATDTNAAVSGTSLTITAGTTNTDLNTGVTTVATLGNLEANGNIIYQGVSGNGNVTIEATGNTDLQGTLDLRGQNLGIISLKAGAASTTNTNTLKMSSFSAASGSNLEISAGGALTIVGSSSGTDKDFVYAGTGDVTVTGGDNSDVNLGDVSFTQSGLEDISFAVGSGALRMNSFSSAGSGKSLNISAGTAGALTIVGSSSGTNKDFVYAGTGDVTVTGGDNSNVNLGDVLLTQSDLGIISFAVGGGALRMNKFSGKSGGRLRIDAGSGALTIGSTGTTENFVYESTGTLNDVTVVGGVGSNVNLGDVLLTGTLRDISFRLGSGTLTMGDFGAGRNNGVLQAVSGTSLTIEAGTITQTGTSDLAYGGFGGVTINATAGNATLGNVILTGTNLGAISLDATGALKMDSFSAASGSSLGIRAAGGALTGGALTIGSSSGTTKNFVYEGIGDITVTGGDNSDVNLGAVSFTKDLGAISFAVGSSGALRMGSFSSIGSSESLNISAGTGALTIGSQNTTDNFVYEGIGDITVEGGDNSDVNLGAVSFTQSGLEDISFAVGSGALRMDSFSAASGTGPYHDSWQHR